MYVKIDRILKWQHQEVVSMDVEEPSLNFEEWSHSALVKTYCRSPHC